MVNNNVFRASLGDEKKSLHRMRCKEQKERRKKKRARIIVRNISFKATEESLRTHFANFGDIEDFVLLKRADGNLVGCAFVQYANVNQATKAILKANNQPLFGRPIYVDWAVNKNEYISKQVKEEEEDDAELDEQANGDADNKCGTRIKTECEEDLSVKSEEIDGSDVDVVGDTNNNQDMKSEVDDEEADIKSDTDIGCVKTEKLKSNDVEEGCTVFIKNVPYDAEDNDLRGVCRKFGPLYYAIINREQISGHSKGTAFVKFKCKESADLCLRAGSDFTLLDQILDPHPALSRTDIHRQKTEKEEENCKKDSRNLYLTREGLITSGSKAAEGVSASDMTKRHKLERIKTEVLKNLNRFVSRNRLSIHNLPLHYDDKKLEKMIHTHTALAPHECRVMRENTITPEYPIGKSKGFGFMSFKSHANALAALRKLNNNPNIFGAVHRPIVAFSIEDRAVHKIKEKRVQKSKLNNPTFREKLENKKLDKKRANARTDDRMKLKKAPSNVDKKEAGNKKDGEAVAMEKFVGMSGKPGAAIRMRSTKKINEQMREHMKRVKSEKKKVRKLKTKRLQRDERNTHIKTKQVRKPEKDDLSSLVKKYKQLIGGSQNNGVEPKPVKRSKWYPD